MHGIRYVDSTGEIIPSVLVDHHPSLMANVPLTATVADNSSLHARLNTKGTHVVCGMKDCGS